MTTTDMSAPASAPAPAVTLATAMSILLAGSAATVAFDLFGQGISPMAGYARLAPTGLANGTIQAVFGTKVAGGGDALHYMTGLVAYPLGWLMIARPVADRIAPQVPKALAAVAYGIVLWAFALYVMAHLVVGMPAFLGFTGITWVALAGHVIYALAFVATWEWRGRAETA